MMPSRRPSTLAVHTPMETEEDFRHCANRLKALADPDRLRIVNSLLKGEKSVSALAEEMDVPIDRVSHHLSVLRAAQLVKTQKQGKFVVYSLPPEIAAAHSDDDCLKTLDLGCCQLDLVQPAPAATRRTSKTRS
jgi:DNA-binding transcriptional ArsR family regulator